MLSPIQERVAALFFSLPGSAGFALAGGGALVARGEVARTTRDLDLFAAHPEEVAQAVEQFRNALPQSGFSFELVRSSPTYCRMIVLAPAGEQVLVDIGYDYRLREPEDVRFGRVLSVDDLAADKVLALFGRAEARDFVDFYFLAKRHGIDKMLALAKEKDPGFDMYVFATMLGTFERHPRAEFEIEDAQHLEMTRYVHELRGQLLASVLGGP
jgi:hypothetical protein